MTAPPAQRAAPTGGRSLQDDIRLLGDLLGEVLRDQEGEHAFALEERVRGLAHGFRAGDGAAGEELAALAAGVDVPAATVLVRAFTKFFQLVNLAEDNDRVRALRAWEADHAGQARPGSLRAAVEALAAGGVGPEELAGTLAHAEVRMVLTAHPTEARRRTTVEKLGRIFGRIRELDERRLLPHDHDLIRGRLAATIEELWASDEIRAVSPTVLDEVRGALVVFRIALVRVIPRLYRDLEEALAAVHPGAEIPVPPFLRFGSWVGGDRDGNPSVTPAVTLEALDVMRESALVFLEGRLEELAQRLSLSTRVVGPAPALAPLLEEGHARLPGLAEALAARNPQEPYRRALTLMLGRLRATRTGAGGAYAGPGALVGDLRCVERALHEHGADLIAGGVLHDVIREAEVFGFHFATLDVRDHARRHEAALAELLDRSAVEPDYRALGEDERRGLLAREIENPRPLIPPRLETASPETQDVVGTFRALAEAAGSGHRDALRTYVVSGAETPSDVLEVLLLMKEAGLAAPAGAGAVLGITPLFESADTLAAGADTMRALLAEPCYRRAVSARSNTQEVMLGYSDSNKDAGYVASAWRIHRAQAEIAAALGEAGVEHTFFHGRGGTIGRGGGPTDAAVAAQPPGTVAGRVKFTEQGEVVTAKYAAREIAHRELESVASAVLTSTLIADGQPPERFAAVLDRLADASRDAYRALVYGDPDFLAFFTAATPVEDIARLRIASRPARRTGAGSIEDLRAIPWVFSWTQARILLPGWYGLGAGLRAAREEHGLEVLREMHAGWPFFATLIDNAEVALAKTDPAVGERYVALVPDTAARERIWTAIAGEHARAVHEVLAVTGRDGLVAGDPVLRRSLPRRDPYLDPLSFVQLELLRRARRGERDEDLVRAILLAINGIAGGMRSTG